VNVLRAPLGWVRRKKRSSFDASQALEQATAAKTRAETLYERVDDIAEASQEAVRHNGFSDAFREFIIKGRP